MIWWRACAGRGSNTHENLGRRRRYRVAGRAGLCPAARSQIRGGRQGKVAAGDRGRQGGRQSLQAVTEQYSGTKERGPLGGCAQRRRAEGRSQNRPRQAEGQDRQRREAIKYKYKRTFAGTAPGS